MGVGGLGRGEARGGKRIRKGDVKGKMGIGKFGSGGFASVSVRGFGNYGGKNMGVENCGGNSGNHGRGEKLGIWGVGSNEEGGGESYRRTREG